MKIESIDVSAKEWFSKTFGNSYHAVQVTINNDKILYVPITYGYGDHFRQSALKVLKDNNIIKTNESALWIYCEANNITLRHTIKRDCLKREVKAWGQE